MQTLRKSSPETPKEILERILRLKLEHPYHPKIKHLQVLYDLMTKEDFKA